MSDAVLALENLTKDYGHRRAVDQLSLTVEANQVYGFLGPNGAGKTTTIRMCLGLVRPSAGRVKLLGVDVWQHRDRVLPLVGALVEAPALYPYMFGEENLRIFGLCLGGASRSRIAEVLDLVGLKDRGGDRVASYSLGMKQRLGLAVALLADPKLLILDEPANGLDPAGIREMREMLINLAASGKTVFVSSHVLAEVQQTCDRVAIIDHGRLVREASVSEPTPEHGEFQVVIEDLGSVLELIRSEPWGRDAHLEDGRLITPAPDGQGRELVRFLAANDRYPDQVLRRERDLEEIFLALTEGGL